MSARAAVDGLHPGNSNITFSGGVPEEVKYNAVGGHHPAESNLALTDEVIADVPRPTSTRAAVGANHPSTSGVTFDGGSPDKVKYVAIDGHHPAESTLSLAPTEGGAEGNRPASTRASVPGQHPTLSKVTFDGGAPDAVKYTAVGGHHPAESTLNLRGLEGSPLPKQPNSARGPAAVPHMGETEEQKYNALAKAHPS